MFDDPGRQRKDFWLIRRKKTPYYYIKFILKLPDGTGKVVIRSTKQTVKYRAERKAREMLKLTEPIQPVKKADPTALVTFEQVASVTLQAIFKEREENGRPYSQSVIHSWPHRLEELNKELIRGASLADITKPFLRERFKEAYQGGRSRRMIQEYHKIIRAIFKELVEKGTVAANPCDGVSIPGKAGVQEKGLFTQEQMVILFGEKNRSAWKSPLYRLGAHLSATTGMRQGEVVALLWEDIRENGFARVKRCHGPMERATNPKERKASVGVHCPVDS